MADDKTQSELFIEERQDTSSRKKALAAGAGGATSFFLAGMLGGPDSPAADLTVMNRAKEMEAAGKDRDYIWKETWKMGQPWMNHHGTWVFEHSDEGTKQIGDIKKLPPYGAITRSKTFESLPRSVVSEYFETPGLDVYPELRETSLHGILAKSPKAQAIHGPPGGKTPSRIELSNYLNSPEAEEAFLHEMHHLIARKIGLPPGSSDSKKEWRQFYTKESFEELKDFYDKSLMKQIAKDFNIPSYEKYRADQIQARKDAGQFIPDTWSREQEQAWKSGHRHHTHKLHGEAISSKSPKLPLAKRKALLETYEHILGEADARNIAARRNLTWEERGDKPYWETYDVPEENLINPLRSKVGGRQLMVNEPRSTDLVPIEEDPSQQKQKSRRLPAKVMSGILSILRRVPGHAGLGVGIYDIATGVWDRLSKSQQDKLIEQVYPPLSQEEEESYIPDEIISLIHAGAEQNRDPNEFIGGLIESDLISEKDAAAANQHFEDGIWLRDNRGKAAGGFVEKPLYDRAV